MLCPGEEMLSHEEIGLSYGLRGDVDIDERVVQVFEQQYCFGHRVKYNQEDISFPGDNENTPIPPSSLSHTTGLTAQPFPSLGIRGRPVRGATQGVTVRVPSGGLSGGAFPDDQLERGGDFATDDSGCQTSSDSTYFSPVMLGNWSLRETLKGYQRISN